MTVNKLRLLAGQQQLLRLDQEELFTRDEWDDSTNGFENLLTISSGGEVESNSWVIKFTDVSGTSTGTTLTFASCKLSVVDISKSVEGAVKADITVICPGEPFTV